MKLLLSLMLFIFTSHISFAKNKRVSNIDQQLVNFEIFQQIVKSSSIPLDKLEGCSSFTYQDSKFVNIKQPNLGHFLSWNLSIFSQNKNNLSLLKCEKNSNTNSCSLKFKSNSGKNDDSPWSCGLKFNIDNSNTVDTSSISCIDAC